jgi:hypothetical protein
MTRGHFKQQWQAQNLLDTRETSLQPATKANQRSRATQIFFSRFRVEMKIAVTRAEYSKGWGAILYFLLYSKYTKTYGSPLHLNQYLKYFMLPYLLVWQTTNDMSCEQTWDMTIAYVIVPYVCTN